MNDSNAGASDSLENALAAAVDQYGPSVLHDTARLRTTLANAAPNSMPQIGALLAAVAQRVPHAMLAAANEDEMAGAMPALVDRMMSLRTLKRDQAVWVVRTWANALAVSTRGLDLDLGEPSPERAVAADARSSVAEVLLGTRQTTDAPVAVAAAVPPTDAVDAATVVARQGAAAPESPPQTQPVASSSEFFELSDDTVMLDSVIRRRAAEAGDETVSVPAADLRPAAKEPDVPRATLVPAGVDASPTPVRPPAEPVPAPVETPAAAPARLDPTLPLDNVDETIIHRPQRVRQPDPEETVMYVPAWAEDPAAAKNARRDAGRVTGVFPELGPPDDARPREARRRGMPLMIVGAIAAIVVVGMVVWQRWSSSEPSEANVSTANVPVVPANPSSTPAVSKGTSKDGGVQAPAGKPGDGAIAPPPTSTPVDATPAPTTVASAPSVASATPTSQPTATPVPAPSVAKAPANAPDSSATKVAAPTADAPVPKAAPSVLDVSVAKAPSTPEPSVAKAPAPAPAAKVVAVPPPKAKAPPPAPTAKAAPATKDKPAARFACTSATCGAVIVSVPSHEPGLFEMVIRMDDRSIQTVTQAIRLKAGARVRRSGARFVVAD